MARHGIKPTRHESEVSKMDEYQVELAERYVAALSRIAELEERFGSPTEEAVERVEQYQAALAATVED